MVFEIHFYKCLGVFSSEYEDNIEPYMKTSEHEKR